MRDELEILKVVTQRLEEAGFAYMVSGSVAMSFYAKPRMTRDIDIVVELTAQDAPRVFNLFKADCYCDPEDVRQAIARRSMFNLVHLDTSVKIDIVVRKDSPFRREELARRRKIEMGDLSLWVVSPEDLILSKLFWAKDSHSEFQMRDVRNLLTSVRGLDDEYLARWARELGVLALLAEARS